MEKEFRLLHDSLDDYLFVHEAIFKQKIGQHSDYEPLNARLESAEKGLNHTQDYFSETTSLNSDQRGVVLSYINDVRGAINDLWAIVKGLEAKASGKGSYGFIRYRKDLKRYSRSSQLHLRYGKELNKIYSELNK